MDASSIARSDGTSVSALLASATYAFMSLNSLVGPEILEPSCRPPNNCGSRTVDGSGRLSLHARFCFAPRAFCVREIAARALTDIVRFFLAEPFGRPGPRWCPHRGRQHCRVSSCGRTPRRSKRGQHARTMHGISRRGGGRSVAPIAYVTEDAPTRKGRGPRLIRSTTVTQNPEVPAPALRCPLCDRSLIYLQTVIGGVKPPERWDYFECVCPAGSFEYRHRARKLRRTPDVPRPRG